MKHLPLDAPFKVIGFLHKRPDLTSEQFRTHWRTVHLCEALKLEEFMSGYVQNHVLDQSVPGFEPYCAGLPILWFDGPETSAAMSESDAYKTGAYVDEPNFMKGRSQGMPCKEIVLEEGPPISQDEDGTKVVVLAKAKNGVDGREFSHALSKNSETLIELDPVPKRVVRSVSVSVGDGNSPFDVAEEYWWEADEAHRRSWGQGAFRPWVGDVLEPSSTRAMQVEELRAVWGKSVSYQKQ